MLVKGRQSKFWRQTHIISIFLLSLGWIRLGYFGLLVIYRTVYFGVVFDLVFKICINYRTYAFKNSITFWLSSWPPILVLNFQPTGGRIEKKEVMGERIIWSLRTKYMANWIFGQKHKNMTSSTCVRTHHHICRYLRKYLVLKNTPGCRPDVTYHVRREEERYG